RISAARMKLLQFASIRPWLLPAIREWSEESGQAPLNLSYSTRIRRGFLSDTAYDDVLNFLVACRVFVREGGQIALGSKGSEVRKVVSGIQGQSLFLSEREAIAALAEIKITNNMLEGCDLPQQNRGAWQSRGWRFCRQHHARARAAG